MHSCRLCQACKETPQPACLGIKQETEETSLLCSVLLIGLSDLVDNRESQPQWWSMGTPTERRFLRLAQGNRVGEWPDKFKNASEMPAAVLQD